MQVQDVLAEGQRLVGVVPDQILDRIDFRIAGHQDAASRGAKLVVNCHVRFLAHAFENAEQRGRFVGVGVFALTGEVPLDEVVIGFSAEEAPGHHAAGVDEVFDEVVWLGDGVGLEGGSRQIVQAFETAPLQQLGQAALQCHLQTRMRPERGKHAAGVRVHQRDAHHRKLAAQ